MKAIGLTRYGGPEVLEVVELPTPEAGPGEVRVRVSAAAVHPADVMLRSGALADWYRDAGPAPYVPGMDIAGVIDEVGPEVPAKVEVAVGQEVVGLVNSYGRHGGYSECVVLPAESVTRSPQAESPAHAASFLMPAMTARAGIDQLGLASGDSLLVTGAAGAVGQAAVALAHADGLRVIALASPRDAEMLRRLGADDFVARSGSATDEVLALVPGGVDALFDTTPAMLGYLPAVRDGGAVVSTRELAQGLPRQISASMVNVRNHMTAHEAMATLVQQVDAGVLPLRVAAVFPADDCVAAHRLFDAGGLSGRVVISF